MREQCCQSGSTASVSSHQWHQLALHLMLRPAAAVHRRPPRTLSRHPVHWHGRQQQGTCAVAAAEAQAQGQALETLCVDGMHVPCTHPTPTTRSWQANGHLPVQHLANDVHPAGSLLHPVTLHHNGVLPGVPGAAPQPADEQQGSQTHTSTPNSPASHSHTSAASSSSSEAEQQHLSGAGSPASSLPHSQRQGQPQQGQQGQPQQAQQGEQQQNQSHQGIPQPILVISFVSALLTMASCVFNTLLPIYMVTELKMNMRSMGMFEGLLEAFSYVVRMFSGVVSDMMTSRKNAITLGFAMGAMAKFGMSGAATVTNLFALKAVDRLANGVQAAPRDALISDLAPEASRSACFGFAQSIRKWGSFLGAGMCYFLMKASNNNYQLIFLMASSVTVAATLAFVLLVPSHARPMSQQETAAKQFKQRTVEAAASGAPAPVAEAVHEPFSLLKLCKDVASMGGDFYRMLFIVCMYGLGHINESMLEARAIEVGFGKAECTLVVALLALVASVSAWPLGRLDDKHGPCTTFAVGMSALIGGNMVLLASGILPWTVFGACAFLGIHWAVIQGPMLSIVVGLAPAHMRGTAFGIFYTVMAMTTMIANCVYGTVWHTMGASAAFGLSVCFMTGTLIALPYLLPESVKHGRGKSAPPQQQQPKLAPA